MSDDAYARGLHRLGNGCFAWLEPPGSWGLSNSGVLVAGDEVLVELTPYDLTKGRITYRFMPGRGGPGPA